MQRRPELPPIWVLNLKRSADRRAHITGHLGGLGLPFELLEAVDGRELAPEELAGFYSPCEALRRLRRELTPSEIGGALSHLKAYRKQLDEGLEEVVILEDDALLEPAFLDVLGRRESLPPDWELVLFCHNNTRVSFWGSRPFGRQRCVKFASVAWGAQGYLLRRSGAQKLLAHGLPVCGPADLLTGGGIRTGVRLYGIDPPCVGELSPEPGRSTMPDAHALRGRWPTKEELGPVVWFLHRWKWRLLHFAQRANPFCIV